ncbi:MAG: hypothetical protein MUE36_11785 [Acidimicrobiales bacterium]|jgi:hypothetical protein|nr:hypothetical protein [Acidimicrobiales bacterium]
MRHADEASLRRMRRREATAWALAVGLLLVVGAGAAFGLRAPSERAASTSATAPATTSAEAPTSEASGDARVEVAAVDADTSAGIEQYRGPDWIREENTRPGTTEWQIPDDPRMWDKVRGFADATSIDFGEDVTLYVSTKAPTWRVDAYRIGYYGGGGGRLIWSSPDQPGVDQPGAVIDSRTNMREAPWAPSLTVQTDDTWPPGQYLFKLISSDGGATFVPLVVRDDGSTAPLLMQSAVTTWQAYNPWGGTNLYTGVNGASETRARVVSFDRPYGGNGSGEFLGREFEFIWFLERLGYDVTYWTNIDLDAQPDRAQQHKAVLIPGHDEYYTVAMRQGLERARDAGVNLAFFGANNVYRRIRLEPSELGERRHEVNYRSASEDPLNGKDNAQVTTSFRDAPAANPESSLIGNYYECNPVKADWVVGDASAWMFAGSGFENGDRVKDMVGNEYDRVTPGVPTPENIQVISHSPVNCRGKASFADSTWYSAPSGAGVFSAGTFGWSPLMDEACPDGVETSPPCRLQKVTQNLLDAFAAGPAGAAHPSVNNLADFGIGAVTGPSPTTTRAP